ncbi:transcriptional regulator swi6, partial [Mortierella sp. GBA39]
MRNKKKSTVQLSRTTTTTTPIESISTNNLRPPTLVNNRVLHFPRTSPSTDTNNRNLHSAGQGTSNTRGTTNIATYEHAHRIPQSVALHQLKTTLGHLKSHHEETLKLIEKRDAIRLRLAILDIEKRLRLLEGYRKQQRRQEELKKQRQYRHQDHHKEPIRLMQANEAQQPQANIENKVGLRAGDFGVDDLERGPSEAPFVPRAFSTAPPSKEENGGKRGKDVMHVVQKMVDELDVEFSQEIMARQGQLKDTQSLLKNATRELTETRRSVIDYRSQAQQVAEAQQKFKDLSLSLEEESQRTRSHKGYNSKLRPPSGEDIDLLFNVWKRTSSDGMTTTGAVEVGGGGEDLKARERMAEDDLVLLRSRVYAYQKNDEELALELAEAKSKTSANELLCKKVIAICCNIQLDK